MSSSRYDSFHSDPDEIPVFSRLFVIGDKRASEDDFREAFSAFGTVQHIKSVKDKHTGDAKGIMYIKMSKTSEAAKAVEEMHGKSLSNFPRPMKVLVACNRSGGEQMTDDDIMEQMMRLFIVVPKSYTEKDIEEHFGKFGVIDKIRIVKDKNSGDSKGLAFVRFHRASHAALAFENCDSDFKPKFADPVGTRPPSKRQFESSWEAPSHRHDHRRGDDHHGSHSMRYGDAGSNMMPRANEARYVAPQAFAPGPFPDFMTNQQTNGVTRLSVEVSPHATQAQLTKLFSIVPNLEYCDLHPNPAKPYSMAYVKYANPQCCTYAKEAINGLEYPPGHPLIISYYQPEAGSASNVGASSSTSGLSGGEWKSGSASSSAQPFSTTAGDTENPQQNLINVLVQNIQQAAMMLRAHGVTAEVPGLGIVTPENRSEDYAHNLPPPQPVFDGEMKKRLFIVAQPTRIPLSVLKDLFCRFGTFITVEYMAGKNCGFVKYGSDESAQAAKAALHGIEVHNVRLKVLDAEDPPEDGYSKKSRST